jgi:glycosyltransferase involved in cell wall biosynthesis
MPEQSRVTALLPLKEFDREFLRRALDSILEQSSPRWRLIVIAEREDLRHFRQLLSAELEDPRVLLVPNQGPGLPGALNTGLREAETDFCAILLGDDMWSRAAVETLEREIASNPEVDFFHSDREKVDEDDRPIGVIFRGKDQIRAEDFLDAAPLKHLLCFRRAKALEIGGLDESFQLVGPDDYDFPWTMAERGATFRRIPEFLYIYREHRRFDRLSTDTSPRARRREIVRMWRKHGAGGIRGAMRALRAGRGTIRKGTWREARPSSARPGGLPRARR